MSKKSGYMMSAGPAEGTSVCGRHARVCVQLHAACRRADSGGVHAGAHCHGLKRPASRMQVSVLHMSLCRRSAIIVACPHVNAMLSWTESLGQCMYLCMYEKLWQDLGGTCCESCHSMLFMRWFLLFKMCLWSAGLCQPAPVMAHFLQTCFLLWSHLGFLGI
jgi:hypothetical protein